MTSAVCAIDQTRPVYGGAAVCPHCLRAVRRDLAAIAGVVADLHVTLSRTDHVQPGNGGRRGTDTPLVYDHDAAEQLRNLHTEMHTWSRTVAALNRLDVTALAGDTVACARWLHDHPELLRRLPDVANLAGHIRRALADGRRATDLGTVSSRFVVGPCPVVLDAAFCDGDVLATITTDERQPPTMACLRCGHVWPSDTWLRAGRMIRNRSDETGWQRPTHQREDDQ